MGRGIRVAVSVATVAAGLVAGPGSAVPQAAPAQAAAASCSAGHVALSFDDGPARPTVRLLRILRDRHVPATFFMVGQRVAAAPAVARRVERSGFLVANHSWAHTDMRTQTAAQVAVSLRATDRALRRAGAHPTRLMRPPYGALDDEARAGIRNAGFVPVLWSVDSRNWAGGTARQIADRILSGLRPHAANIVLQHDGVGHSPVSVDAVAAVIRGARRRGYCFTALDERGRPGYPTPDTSVSVTDAREGESAVATVRLSAPPGRPTSVRLRTRSLTARAGEDVARIARRVRIPAGRLRVRVRIPVVRDGIDEFGERFAVVIDRPRGVRIRDGEAVSRVADVDRPPVVRGVDTTVSRPADEPVEVAVRFRLSRPSGKPIPVVLATRAGSADDTDYVPFRTRVVLSPGTTVLSHGLTVLPAVVGAVEADEVLTVEVVRARRVRVGRGATVALLAPQPPPDPGTPG